MIARSVRRWPLYAVSAVCVTLGLFALKNAVSWYGDPTAGLFVDPGGVVSDIAFPGWEGRRKGLAFPDIVLSVDTKPLGTGDGTSPGNVWDAEIERAWKAGQRQVQVVVRTRRGLQSSMLHLQPLEPAAWWIYAGSFLFAAALYAVAGLVALSARPGNALARTFAQASLSVAVFVGLMFDFHTTRQFSWLFFVAFAMVPPSWVMLALRLPDDVALLRRFPWLEYVAIGVGISIAAVFLFLTASGHRTVGLQALWTPALGISLLFFGATFTVRFLRAQGVRRARLRALLVSVAPPHVGIGAFFFIHGLHAATAEALSFVTLSLFPIATGYAFIRYDLWSSRALLSRILTRLAVGSTVCVIAIAIGTALAASLGAPFGQAFIAASVSGVIASVLVLAALRFVDQRVFAARTKYKPTVEQLSEDLIVITSPDEVARSVERTIRRWLPCERVELSVEPQARRDDSESGLIDVGALNDLREHAGAEHLALPVEFGGVRLGSLRVGEKAGGALFTSDDLDLLRTIANQGALALAHAFAYQELEARRREQAAAWRGERAALVETVAAEIAHEIRYPINFFRSVFDTTKRGAPLDADDVEIGAEEVGRLERLVSGLRRMASHRIERKSLTVSLLCDRVETLLRDSLGERRIVRAVPAAAQIRCDIDQATQILVNLVANALQAAGTEGSVGVTWSDKVDHSELVVWDDGPGFEGDGTTLFAPWYTTKAKGTGLGLAITHRLVRAHGWNISATRDDDRTTFTIRIRPEDVVAHRRSAEVA